MTKTWKQNEVWAMTVPDKYRITVNRTKPYEGLLTVREDQPDYSSRMGSILYQESVTLSKDARWGPDDEDVAQWTDTVAKFIDERSTMAELNTST